MADPELAQPTATIAAPTLPSDFNGDIGQLQPQGYTMESNQGGAAAAGPPVGGGVVGRGYQVMAEPVPSAQWAEEGNVCGVKNTWCVKIVHFGVIAMSIIMFIACCVAFGGELHHITPADTGGVTYRFYHSYYTQGQSQVNYNDVSNNALSKCDYGGKALVAVMVFAFLAILLLLPLLLIRMSGRVVHHLITSYGLHVETFLSFFLVVMFILGAIIWGANCISQSADFVAADSYSLSPTGYAFLDFACVTAILTFVFSIIIRSSEYYKTFGRTGGGQTAPLLG